MKILVTGTKGIGQALAQVYADHAVTCVSRSTGHDINLVNCWGFEFLQHDMVFNNAYDGFGQIVLLEYFYNAWKHDPSKKIITVGSRSSYMPALDTKHVAHWPYQIHKQALQHTHDRMIQDAKCDLKIINPGPVDTDMVSHLDIDKMSPIELAQRIVAVVQDSAIKRMDLWL